MKYLTIALLTLFVSMGVNSTSIGFIYVPGNDDGGWMVLLFFLGFLIFIAIASLFSTAKETIEEKIEFKKKESYKKDIGPDKYREAMAERFWNEECYSASLSLNKDFNYKDLEQNNWTYHDFCLDCSFFGEITQYGLYKVYAIPHFESWLSNQEKKHSEKYNKSVSYCPRCPQRFREYMVASSSHLCEFREELSIRRFGLPQEVQTEVCHLLKAHSDYIKKRRESVFFTPEQSERLSKIKELGVEDLTMDQILQGEEPAVNPYIDEPLKNLSHPFSKFCRDLRYGRFYPFYAIKEYREDDDLLIGYAEDILDKDKSTNYRYQLDKTEDEEFAHRIEVNYFTFSYKSLKKIMTENPYDAFDPSSFGTDVFFPELDSLASIKVQDDFSEDQERHQKEIAKKYLKDHN